MATIHIVASFASPTEATAVESELARFLPAHADEKDDQRDFGDPADPTVARQHLDARHQIDSSSPPLTWGFSLMADDLPTVSTLEERLLIQHTNCDGLEFIEDYLRARGGRVSCGRGALLAGIYVRFVGAAGERRRSELDRFFDASSRPGARVAAPWRPELNTVTRDGQRWFSDKTQGLASLPLWVDELDALARYFTGSGFQGYELSIGGSPIVTTLRHLESVRRCHECGADDVELVFKDDSIPDDQILCASCGGMFSVEVASLHAPVQHLCEERLKSPIADGNILYAVSYRGDVWRREGTWEKVADTPLSLIALHALGERLLIGGRGGTLRLSTNGGRRWISPRHTLRGWVQGFRASPDGALFAFGDGVIRSLDGGASWSTVLEKSDGDVLGLCALSADIVFACTREGKVMASRDGGARWKTREATAGAALTRIVARSEKVLIAVGDRGTIVKTTNGKKWRAVSSPTDFDIEDLIVGNDGRYYAIDLGGNVLVSSDGDEWSAHASGATNRMWGLAATASGALLCVGDGGTALLRHGLDSKRR